MWEPFKSYDQKARFIIEHNNYAVVSTSDKSGAPWGAVVFYAPDQNYNFYFISAIDSLHAKNIKENPEVAMVIFDSRTPIGSYDEVQLTGKASIVEPEGVKAAISVYKEKLFAHSRNSESEPYSPGEYMAPAEFRFFKVVPKNVYTTGINRRTEVNLKSYGGK